jgi:hypothetical protein
LSSANALRASMHLFRIWRVSISALGGKGGKPLNGRFGSKISTAGGITFFRFANRSRGHVYGIDISKKYVYEFHFYQYV